MPAAHLPVGAIPDMKPMKKLMLLLLLLSPIWASAQPYVTNKKKVAELHRQLKASKPDSARVNIYIELCKNIELRKRDSLLHYASLALTLSKKIGDRNGEGKGHLMYAVALRGIGYYGEQGSIKDILSHLEKAEKIFKTTGDEFQLAETYRQISRTHYVMKSDYVTGYKYNMQALKIYERLGKKREMSYLYEDLSILYSSADEIKEQLYYLNKSLALNIELNDSTAIGDKKGYIGICYKDSGRYELALQNMFEGLKIFEQMGSNSPDYGVPWIKGCIGEVYVLQAKELISKKNVEAGKSKLESALKLFIDRFNAETAGKMSHRETYHQLAECHLLLSDVTTGKERQHHISESLKYYSVSNKTLINTDNDWMISISYLGLSKGYEAMGDYKSAYDNHKRYVLYRDKYEDQRKESELLKLKMQHAFANEKEKVKAEQAKKDAEAKRAKTQQLSIIVALGAIVLAVLVIVFILFKNNKQKQKANHLLQDEKEKVEAALGELKATQQQLVQSEKMASLGELTAGIAHEIQNPLNFVNNFSEVSNELIAELEDERQKPKDQRDEALIAEILTDVKQNLEKINHHGKRADAIVKGMLQHSRTSSGQKEPTDLNALADEYLRLAYHGLRAKDKSFNAELVTDFDPSVGKVNVVAQDIGRVILNLITNAFHAVNEKKKSGIEGYKPNVSVTTKKNGKRVTISVTDNGNGIPEAIREKIFQPFFTTKPTGEGTGLGLSLSYDIITKGHGGTIDIKSEPGQFTTFTINLTT